MAGAILQSKIHVLALKKSISNLNLMGSAMRRSLRSFMMLKKSCAPAF